MSSQLFIKCIKDTEGYWTEGEMYAAQVVTGGFVQLGDDDDLNGDCWSAAPSEYRDDGSIIYQVGGLDGDVQFEEQAGCEKPLTEAERKEVRDAISRYISRRKEEERVP